MLKRIFLIATLMAFVCAFVPASTYAVPVINGYNGLFFNNAEVFIDMTDSPTTIDVGDIFWGVMGLQNILAPTGPTGQTGPQTWVNGGVLQPPVEITGYFAQQIVALETGPSGESVIVFGPVASDPNNILPTGAVLQLFEDSTINYNTATQATGLSTATDGTPSWTLGLGASTDGDSTAGYWYSFAPTTIPSASTTPIGTSYAGFNFLDDGSLFNAIDDPNEVYLNLLVEVWFNTEIFDEGVYYTADAATLFHFGSNDPAVVNVVPEPATMLLLGAGLIGLAGIGRRKFFKK